MKKILFLIGCSLIALTACNQPAADKAATEGCGGVSKDSMLLVMNVPIKILPDSIASFKTAFAACQAESQKEPGCQVYEIYQSYTDSTVFHLYEVWQNKPEHLKHMETPHFKTYIELTKPMNDPAKQGQTQEIYVCPMVNK